MPSPTLYDVANIFNSQPHIDEIKEGLSGTEEHMSKEFTFMLQHKHFDLLPGEVLFVDKVETGYNVSVKDRNLLGNDSSPCMWMYSSGWKPFGYTKARLGREKVPEMLQGNYNLGVRWLNNGGTESTDEKERLQWVRPDEGDDEDTLVTTLVNWEESSACISNCISVSCAKRKTRHGHEFHVTAHHRRPHYDSSSINVEVELDSTNDEE